MLIDIYSPRGMSHPGAGLVILDLPCNDLLASGTRKTPGRDGGRTLLTVERLLELLVQLPEDLSIGHALFLPKRSQANAGLAGRTSTAYYGSTYLLLHEGGSIGPLQLWGASLGPGAAVHQTKDAASVVHCCMREESYYKKKCNLSNDRYQNSSSEPLLASPVCLPLGVFFHIRNMNEQFERHRVARTDPHATHLKIHVPWKWMAWSLGRLFSSRNRGFSTSMFVSQRILYITQKYGHHVDY